MKSSIYFQLNADDPTSDWFLKISVAENRGEEAIEIQLHNSDSTKPAQIFTVTHNNWRRITNFLTNSEIK